MPKPKRDGTRQQAAAGTAAPAMPLSYFLLGFLALGTATLASGALVLEHFDAAELPGCGANSGCAQATNSVWGKIPGWGLPVSIVGLAYFGSMLVGWLCTAGRVAWSLRGLVWLGGFLSAVYIGLMWFGGWLCPWCLTAHLANVVFVAATEASFRPIRTFNRSTLLTAGGFIAALAILAGLDWRHQQHLDAEAEALRQESTQEIIRQGAQRAAATQPAATTHSGAPAAPAETPEPKPDEPATPAAAPSSQPTGASKLFTGRYRVGPERAPIRIVMFTDYQCPDCRIRERELAELMQSRSDMSVSIKHFPFCSDCNPGIPNLHRNACWAARAAEAAGILGGSEAFWKMHQWLFSRQGKFETNEQLMDGVQAAGLEFQPFVKLMRSQATLDNISADIAEAKELGIERTPMIFVNGVELKGWQAPRALITTVEQVAAASPPVLGPEADQPPTAMERYLSQWRESNVRQIPADEAAVTFGEPGAQPLVIMWGDYEEPGTSEADKIIREFVQSSGGSYVFRLFPFAKSCNPVLTNDKEDRHKNACRMAAAVLAAESAGGANAARSMHEWLMKIGPAYTEAKLRDAASSMQLDPDKLLAQMDDASIKQTIQREIRAAQDVGLQSIPLVFVNGKQAGRVSYQGQSILRNILAEAAR